METATDTATAAVTTGQLLTEATGVLTAAGVHTPRLDAEILLAAACGTDRGALYARLRDAPSLRCRDDFLSMLTRRVAREPVQYIVGRQEFWSLDFLVTPAVLIPRPETERLVELAVRLFSVEDKPERPPRPTLCDLGTGSGCIAVALARELPEAEIWALDVSSEALAVAATNARRHGVAERLRFVESDLFAAVGGQRFDAVISNPPYVSTSDLRNAQPELGWEPRAALDGGATGREVIRPLIDAAPEVLVKGGWLIMEIGANQAAAVAELAAAAGFGSVAVHADYAGLPRVLAARR